MMYSSFHLYFPLKKFGLSREKSTGKIQLKIPFSFLGNQLPIVILPYFYEWFLPSPPTPSQPPPGPLQLTTCNRSFNQCGFFPHAGNTPIPNTFGWLGLEIPSYLYQLRSVRSTPRRLALCQAIPLQRQKIRIPLSPGRVVPYPGIPPLPCEAGCVPA